MGMTPASELIRLWTQENLDTERAIGQILQHLVHLHTTADVQRLALAQLRAEVNNFQAERERPPSEPSATNLKKSSKRR